MIEPISCPQTLNPAPGAPQAYDREGAAPPAAVTSHPGQLRDAELERLGEAIAELSLQIDAATYQLLVLIRGDAGARAGRESERGLEGTSGARPLPVAGSVDAPS